jgi:peptide-methionine (S)-S-oxide reductase
VRLTYDPDVVSYWDLLTVFFGTHDPTTLNKQMYDVGTQYRSAIFHLNDEQKQQAEKYMDLLEEENIFDDPVVTELTKAGIFYKAENEHQDYYNQHRQQGYCTAIIDPKVQKLKDYHSDLLKEEAVSE